MKKLFAASIVLIMLVCLAACGSSNQTTTAPAEAKWEAKDVQLLVAAKAGGGTDVVGRIIAKGMSDLSKKNVVVVNKTEGGGAVCFNDIQTASEKGDILGFLINSYITSYISGVHDTSPLEDLQYAIIMENISSCPCVVVNAKSPFNTMQELVEYIKANPGKVTFGTQLGTASHYTIADFCDSQGLEVEYLESGSDSDKVTGLMGGLFDVSTINANQANQYVAAGELKALMKLGSFDPETAKTLTALTSVPDVEGCGYKPLRTRNMFFIAAPKSVPASVMQEICDSVKTALEDQSVQEQLAKAGYNKLKIYDYSEANTFMKSNYEAYASLGKTLGLNAEGR